LALVALLAEAPVKKEKKILETLQKSLKTGQLSRRQAYI
jgi:hypothetical protein